MQAVIRVNGYVELPTGKRVRVKGWERWGIYDQLPEWHDTWLNAAEKVLDILISDAVYADRTIKAVYTAYFFRTHFHGRVHLIFPRWYSPVAWYAFWTTRCAAEYRRVIRRLKAEAKRDRQESQ